MFEVRAYKSVHDEKPTAVLKKDKQSGAEFVAMQMLNKFEMVEVINEDGGSIFAAYLAKVNK
jgi:hypothetical protein